MHLLMGCGSFCAGKWLQWKWPNEWLLSNIMVNEIVPIVLRCVLWSCELAKHLVCVQCDNFSIVVAITKGAAIFSRITNVDRAQIDQHN